MLRVLIGSSVENRSRAFSTTLTILDLSVVRIKLAADRPLQISRISFGDCESDRNVSAALSALDFHRLNRRCDIPARDEIFVSKNSLFKSEDFCPTLEDSTNAQSRKTRAWRKEFAQTKTRQD